MGGEMYADALVKVAELIDIGSKQTRGGDRGGVQHWGGEQEAILLEVQHIPNIIYI